jgi:hypothetical protein
MGRIYWGIYYAAYIFMDLRSVRYTFIVRDEARVQLRQEPILIQSLIDRYHNFVVDPGATQQE